MRKYLLLFFTGMLTLFAATDAMAQDPQFTQFYANPIYLNPAFAGSARCPRFVANYRNQWPGIPKTYQTYCASYDQHFEAIGGGVGLQVLRDEAGSGKLSTTQFTGIYAYQLNVSRKFTLRAALQGSFFQKTIDFNKLTFGDMIDDRSGFVYPTQEAWGNQTKSFPDLSTGILGYSKYYFVGAAFHHLFQPNESLLGGYTVLPMKITAHAGTTLPVGKEDLTISPNILFQQQKDFKQLNLGLYFNKGPMVGGLWYRNQDAIILLLGINYKNLKIGYSYDVTISKLSLASAGSHELSLGYTVYCKPKVKHFKTMSCPSF